MSLSPASYLFLCLPWILMAAQGVHVKRSLPLSLSPVRQLKAILRPKAEGGSR